MSPLFDRVSNNRNIKQKHVEHWCLAIEGQQIKMSEGEQIYFKNGFRKFEAPYVIYDDFECFTMECSVNIQTNRSKQT